MANPYNEKQRRSEAWLAVMKRRDDARKIRAAAARLESRRVMEHILGELTVEDFITPQANSLSYAFVSPSSPYGFRDNTGDEWAAARSAEECSRGDWRNLPSVCILSSR